MKNIQQVNVVSIAEGVAFIDITKNIMIREIVRDHQIMNALELGITFKLIVKSLLCLIYKQVLQKA